MTAGDTVQRPATEAARVRSDSMVRRPHSPQAAVVDHLPALAEPHRQSIHRLAGDRDVEHVAARLGLDVEAVSIAPISAPSRTTSSASRKPAARAQILARRAHDHREGRAVDAHLHRLLDGDRIVIGSVAVPRRRSTRDDAHAAPRRPRREATTGDRRSRPGRLGRPGRGGRADQPLQFDDDVLQRRRLDEERDRTRRRAPGWRCRRRCVPTARGPGCGGCGRRP